MRRIIYKGLFILLLSAIISGNFSFSSGFANPPVAVDDISTTNEDVAVVIDILANDTDPEGNLDPTSVTITVLPAHGIATVNPVTGVVTYTPYGNYNGTDTFEYEVCDLDLTCDQAVVTVTVNPVNDPPDINDNAAETAENNPVIIDILDNDGDPNDEDLQLPINILGNDTDPQGNIDPETVQIIVTASHGTLNVNPFSGLVIYTSEPNYNGTDSFIYEVCDTDGYCDQAEVTITINPVNDTVVALDDSDITQENMPVSTNILINDDDPYDPLGNVDSGSLTIITPPQNGMVSIDPVTSNVTYTPETGFYGTDFYIYEVCDDGYPLPATCDMATVTITVSHDSPTVVDDYATTNEDTQTDIDILENDSDPQNNFDLNSLAIISDPIHGTASVDNITGILTYNPDPGYHGQDTLQYEICDMDNYCGQAMVFINPTGKWYNDS